MSQRGPESGSESQWEPEWESQRAIESQRETERDPVRARESLREQARAKKEVSLTFFCVPKHCFVAKQLNKTLFCRDTSKYGIFCRKLLKYALRAGKNGCKCAESRLHIFSNSGQNHFFAVTNRFRKKNRPGDCLVDLLCFELLSSEYFC